MRGQRATHIHTRAIVYLYSHTYKENIDQVLQVDDLR